MNTHDKYTLPPLPEGMVLEGIWVCPEDELISYRDACIQAAIEADRERRGSIVNNASASSEPVAWLRNERGIHADKEIFDPLIILGSEPPIKTANGATYSPVFAAPQPAEPSKGETALYTSQEALDLISRSDAVVSVGLTRVPQMSWNVPLYSAPQPTEPVKSTCKKCNGTGVESTRFHGVWPNGEECLEPLKCDQCDGVGTTSTAEMVKGLSAEQLAEILAAYIKPEIIGKALEKLENAPWELSEPVKVDAEVSVPSDDEIIELRSEFDWREHYGNIRFARGLVAPYN